MEPLCGTKLSLARTYGQMWQVESISHLAEQGMKQASIFLKKKNLKHEKDSRGGWDTGGSCSNLLREVIVSQVSTTYVHTCTYVATVLHTAGLLLGRPL